MSLRTRLLLGLLGLVSVGLIASDFITYRFLQSFLMERLDEQVQAAVDPVASRLSAGERRSPPLNRTAVPGGTYGAVVDNDGKVVISRPFGYEGDDLDSLPEPRLTLGDLGRRAPFTTPAVQRGAPGFRVVVVPLSAGDGSLVVAVPMNDVVQTLRRLVLIELVTTAAVLAAVGGLALVVVRAGLRPLEDIGETAGAIAEGDLSRRVDRAEPRTEVGRLGLSLNAMLAQIQTAFEARQASEDRLRRFVADASHELRTPLTSIRGYAEMFRRGTSDRPEDLATSMRRIEQESERMGVLVDDLLLLARLDQGRPLERRPVDLTRVAADAVADARAVEPERTITLEGPEEALVLGDELRLRQVAANLLSNARQHTPATAAVRVGVRQENGAVVLEVADEGPGLFPEEAAKVFERFYRADPSRNRNLGGTGLGLSIVAAVAQAHGGRADVESVPGHGARFWVELPSVPPAEGQGGDEVHTDQLVERSLDVERVRRTFRRRTDGDLSHDR
ncbi:MAG TPA: HAMP domain-containing sensor histidine kinase [Acidimicrobiales bacterium]|nr:HAMP domain-containing sensor histidine kinase [Acidimicrobiales bacterium]